MILDFLFPRHCIICNTENIWLCEPCLSLIKGQMTKSILRKADIAIEHVWISSYANPVIQKIIHLLKYSQAKALEDDCVRLIKTWFVCGGRVLMDNQEYVSIFPIPTDPEHIRERGFDHTVALAKIVHHAILPHLQIDTNTIIRVAGKHANADLESAEERQGNVKGVFIATKRISGHVLLVDDVCTTGSTALELAQALYKNGAEKVSLFTLAKGK